MMDCCSCSSEFRLAIQAIFEDSFHARVIQRGVRQRPPARVIKPPGFQLPSQADDSQTRTVRVFRERAGGHDSLDQRLHVRTVFGGPRDDPLGSPFEMLLMRGRHVLFACGVAVLAETARMREDPLPIPVKLDQCRRGSYLQLPVD